MSGINIVPHPPGASPEVQLTRLPHIKTYEVMEHDLRSLESLISDESQALGFGTFIWGLVASAVITVLTAPMEDMLKLLFKLGIGLLCIPGVWFTVVYLKKRRQRPRLLNWIRGVSQPIASPTSVAPVQPPPT